MDDAWNELFLRQEAGMHMPVQRLDAVKTATKDMAVKFHHFAIYLPQSTEPSPLSSARCLALAHYRLCVALALPPYSLPFRS